MVAHIFPKEISTFLCDCVVDYMGKGTTNCETERYTPLSKIVWGISTEFLRPMVTRPGFRLSRKKYFVLRLGIQHKEQLVLAILKDTASR